MCGQTNVFMNTFLILTPNNKIFKNIFKNEFCLSLKNHYSLPLCFFFQPGGMADVRMMPHTQGSISQSVVFDVLDLFDIMNFIPNYEYNYMNRTKDSGVRKWVERACCTTKRDTVETKWWSNWKNAIKTCVCEFHTISHEGDIQFLACFQIP